MAKYPNKLKEWREIRGFTQPYVAEQIGCSDSHYKKLEAGDRKLSPKWLKKLAPLLDVTFDELLGASGVRVSGGALANKSSVIEIAEWDFKAGLGDGEVLAVEHPVAHWSAPKGHFGRHGELVIVDTKGDSMQPTIVAGDRVVIDQADRDPSQGGMFAIWDGYGLKVKRVETIAQSKPRKIRVLSENPIYPPDEIVIEDATIVGRVVGLIRSFA